jgi:hypothetical protein
MEAQSGNVVLRQGAQDVGEARVTALAHQTTGLLAKGRLPH